MAVDQQQIHKMEIKQTSKSFDIKKINYQKGENML